MRAPDRMWSALREQSTSPQQDFAIDIEQLIANCDDSVQPDFEVVGTYERSFTGPDTGTEVLDFVSRAPLNADIQLQVPIQKLSDTIACSP